MKKISLLESIYNKTKILLEDFSSIIGISYEASNLIVYCICLPLLIFGLSYIIIKLNKLI